MIQDQASVIETIEFSLKDVCYKKLKKQFPLIEKYNEQLVDCMSKKVKAIDFCNEFIDKKKSLSSARVLKNKVKCIIASSVIFKYQCDDQSDTYCDDKDIGCFMIKEDFAKRLQLIHSSLIKTDNQKRLNCNFSSSKILQTK